MPAPQPQPTSKGQLAEQAAAQYLQAHGLKQIVRNYHCHFGEIDLIMQDGVTLVFVEVRLRSSANFGGAAASIDTPKQFKLIKSAQHYLASLPHIPPCRFDAVLFDKTGNIEWLRNAFEV